MTAANPESRLALMGQLRHFFESYRMLTEQIRQALDKQDAILMERMVDLRAQTAQRIEQFESANPALLALPFEKETDPAVRSVRAEIRTLAGRCQELEAGLVERMEALRADLKQQADGLAKGQRGLKGYAQGVPDLARYIEATK